MIKRFFPKFDHHFNRSLSQVMGGDDRVAVVVLTTVGKYFSGF